MASSFDEEFAAYFEVLGSYKAEDILPVHRYRSKRTGITIGLATVEGPAVHGYFCLATEAHDDDGVPHTLEHLIFLGSELYPYKGVLDLAANRCLASGTNAWTDTDHTCYTVVTAGAQGFLQLLPIYLDHILYPVLSDAGFITEVHHVNAEGEDAGVVYCEMQARENTAESLAHLSMLRLMYPEPSGYRSETGGIMKNLRESTNNEEIRKYHAEFYRPENLCIIVAGRVELRDLLSALLPFEERILSKGERSPFVRPWQSAVPPVTESRDDVVLYPCDDETNGLVSAAWRGPGCKELKKLAALGQLSEYLTDSAISPLQREFVEVDDPFCTNVQNFMIENSETCLALHFENVAINKLENVKSKLLEVLRNIADGKEELDMERIKTLCRRAGLSVLNNLEMSPHDIIAQHLIGDFLYGSGGDDLNVRLNQASVLRELRDEPKQFWLQLLKETFLENKLILTMGKPSSELMAKMAAEEEVRVADQQNCLGEDGLKLKAESLQEATKKNEEPPPDNMITSIAVPSLSSIHFLSVKRCSNLPGQTTQQDVDFPVDKMPVCFLLDDATSNFVQLTALLDTSHLETNMRLYLPLLAEVLLESPILRNDKLISHEDVIFQLSEDTIKSVAMLGIGMDDETPRFTCSTFAQMFQLVIKVELKRYSKGVQWLKELLFQTQFTVERLKIIASKIVNSVAHMKRTGSVVVRSLIKELCFGNESNHYTNNMLRQQTFLNNLLKQLEENPDEVIKDMYELRRSLTSNGNIVVHMMADMNRLQQVEDTVVPWMSFLPADQSTPSQIKGISSMKHDHELILPLENIPFKGGLVGLGSVESAYFVQAVPGISSYSHPDLPAIMVLIQYLTQLEGPMWRQIRGLGLAYNFSVSVKPEEGLIFLLLFKCSHVVSAYKEAKRILNDHISGKESWDAALLDSARSSLIFEIIDHEKNLPDVCHESLLSYFRGVESNFNRTMLQKVSEVTVQELNDVGAKYFRSLVSGEHARCSVCCNSSKVDEVVHGFKDASCELEVLPSLESSFLCKL